MAPVTEPIEKPAAPLTGCLLRVVDGPDAGRELAMTRDSVTVGTAASASLRLSDATVSGTHARFTVTPRGIEVEDLQSRNGTFYLGSQLQSAVVPIGATVRLGRSRVALASPRSVDGAESDLVRYGSLIGASPAMRRLYAQMEQLERHQYPVLVLGETGVGKELVAREIHAHGKRAGGPYQVCDCTTLPRTLAESELFGHERGAFTGATSTRDGVFTRAHTGTIFIDEVGELPLELQPKLLRVLESHELKPLGGDSMRTVDVRVIAATNRDLLAESRAGRFREDLFYRLNAVTLEVPPLRERREDIPALVHHFIGESGEAPEVMSRETLELFTTGYDWPGNVRELKNAVRRVLALGALPPQLGDAEVDAASDEARPRVDLSSQFQEAKRRVIDAFERDYLSEQMRLAGDNISQAARSSGVERMQFKRLLKKHGLLGGKADE